MGTELIARGLVLGADDSADSWSLKRPDDVRAVHASYVAAGSDVLFTNTFNLASARVPTADKAAIAIAAVELARAAGGQRIWGSIGPAGVDGEYARAGELLAHAGVEALILETSLDPVELDRALASVTPIGLPVIASITVARGDLGLQTPTGAPLGKMLRIVTKHAPFAIGLNCSLDAERMSVAVAALASQTDLPILAKPQAKEPGKCLVPKNPETTTWFTQHAMELSRQGATAVGGCCGVGPTAISAMRLALNAAWPERYAS